MENSNIYVILKMEKTRIPWHFSKHLSPDQLQRLDEIEKFREEMIKHFDKTIKRSKTKNTAIETLEEAFELAALAIKKE